jgi:hypothetical protein
LTAALTSPAEDEMSEREKKIMLWSGFLLVALAIISALTIILSYPK